MTTLPHAWAEVSLGALLRVEYGKGLPQADRDSAGVVPVYGSSGIVGRHDRPLVEGPVVIIGRKGNVGAAHVSLAPCWPIDTTYFVRVSSGLDAKFLAYQLDVMRLGSLDSSTAVPSLRRPDLEAQLLIVPPAEEQRRIVAALEEQLSRLEAAERLVRRAQANLASMRAAVLQAATPDDSAPRRIGDLVAPERRIAYGVLQPGGHVDDGIPLVRVGDIENGRVNTSNLKRIASEVSDKFPRTRLRGGEVVVSVVGTIGRTAVAPALLRGANVARAVAVIPVADDVSPEYVSLMLARPSVTTQLVGLAHEVARKTLNLEDVRRFAIPVPSLIEQHRIVDEAQRRLSLVDSLATSVETARSRTAGLRQSILEHAFRGKLVSQDPADEPASALLERVGTDRASKSAPRHRSVSA